MATFELMINTVLDWLKIPFTIYGYTISLWTIIVYSLLASFVVWFIVRFFDFGG